MTDNGNAGRRARVFDFLRRNGIEYDVYCHPEAPTIEIARQYWRRDGSKHCKNLFFRNHKGNRHYLVVFDCERSLAIHDLEHRLHQGKLSFASEQRMERYLGLRPGSVSPFGLINDAENHVHLFLDRTLSMPWATPMNTSRSTTRPTAPAATDEDGYDAGIHGSGTAAGGLYHIHVGGFGSAYSINASSSQYTRCTGRPMTL